MINRWTDVGSRPNRRRLDVSGAQKFYREMHFCVGRAALRSRPYRCKLLTRTLLVFEIPLVGVANAIGKRDLRSPTHLIDPRHIEELARRAVWS